MTDTIPVPHELRPLVRAIREQMRPKAIWLFGSRARGDEREGSDWDLMVGLRDDATEELLDPLFGWQLQRQVGVQATIVAARAADLAESWGVPNTLGFELARDAKLLDG